MLHSPANRLDRRRFLASLALGGAGLLSGCARRAGSGGHANGWYAWMADTHIAGDPSTAVHGQVMAEHLRAVVADLLAATDPPLGVLIAGDLAFKTGRAADYERFLAVVEPLRSAGIPFHATPGNHDDRAPLGAAL